MQTSTGMEQFRTCKGFAISQLLETPKNNIKLTFCSNNNNNTHSIIIDAQNTVTYVCIANWIDLFYVKVTHSQSGYITSMTFETGTQFWGWMNVEKHCPKIRLLTHCKNKTNVLHKFAGICWNFAQICVNGIIISIFILL